MVKNSSALNDSTLAELIRVKNFKQALKNVDKKLKKQPKDVELLVGSKYLRAIAIFGRR